MNIQKLLITKCAPTLANIKTACMFPLRGCNDFFEYKIEILNRLLNRKGIYVVILKSTGDFSLLLVYRKKLLVSDLKNPEAKEILRSIGYTHDNVKDILQHLKYRFLTSEQFPHEIGLFLGYPVSDVKSFITQSGKNGIYNGYWKVYDNLEDAKMTFKAFDKCKEKYTKMYQNGSSILELSKI